MNIRLLLLAALFEALVSDGVTSLSAIPIQWKDIKFHVGGAVSMTYSTGVTEKDLEDTLHVGPLSIYLDATLTATYHEWSAGFEPDLSISGIRDKTIFRQAWIGYQYSEKTSFRAGIIPTAEYISMPPPNLNPGTRDARTLNKRYGVGASMHQVYGSRKQIGVDISVTTDATDSFQRWSGPSIGINVSDKFGMYTSIFLAGSYNVGTGRASGNVGASYSRKIYGNLSTSLTGYVGDRFGLGWTTSFQVTERIGVHASVDASSAGDVNETLGLGWWLGKNKKLLFSADYTHLGGKRSEANTGYGYIQDSSILSQEEHSGTFRMTYFFQ
jgi:hypothetical protein